MKKRLLIHLKDEGQDILYFTIEIVDGFGFVIECGPFHNQLYAQWILRPKDVKQLVVGGDLTLANPHENFKTLTFRWPIESVGEIEDVEVAV